MATVQKLKSPCTGKISYKAIIRKVGHSIKTRTFARKSDAQRWANEVEGTGAVYQDHRVTLAALIDSATSDPKFNTNSANKRGQLEWWKDRLGDKRASEVTAADIEEQLGEFVNAKASTHNRYLTTLGTVYRWAMSSTRRDRYRMVVNPCSNPDLKRREPRPRVRYLNDEEREALYAACRRSYWSKMYALVLMAVHTGARLGELQSLRWRDVNLKKRTALLHTTKNEEPRVLTLTPEVRDELMRFRGRPDEVVFCGRNPNRHYVIQYEWERIRKEIDIKDFTFHDLRHTHASYLAQHGASTIQIAESLGHKHLDMAKRYSHLGIEDKRKLNDEVFSSKSG